MSNPLVDRIPQRFLPLAALAAGRPDAAAVHLAGMAEQSSHSASALGSEVEELRLEVAQLREELSVALEFVDRLGAVRPAPES